MTKVIPVRLFTVVVSLIYPFLAATPDSTATTWFSPIPQCHFADTCAAVLTVSLAGPLTYHFHLDYRPAPAITVTTTIVSVSLFCCVISLAVQSCVHTT